AGVLAPIAAFIPPLAPFAPAIGVVSTLTGVGSKIASMADLATSGSALKKRKKKGGKLDVVLGDPSADMIPYCYKPYNPSDHDGMSIEELEQYNRNLEKGGYF